MAQEKRRDIGLGGLSSVSLAEARVGEYEKHKAAREGGNPIAERLDEQESSRHFQKRPAEFKGGANRGNNGLLTIAMAAFDVDSGASPDAVKTKRAGYTY